METIDKNICYFFHCLRDCGTGQLQRGVSAFLQAREPDEEYMKPCPFNSNCVVQQNRALLEHKRYAIRTSSSLCDKWVFIAVYKEWFGTCTMRWQGRSHDSFIADVTDDSSCVTLSIKV